MKKLILQDSLFWRIHIEHVSFMFSGQSFFGECTKKNMSVSCLTFKEHITCNLQSLLPMSLYALFLGCFMICFSAPWFLACKLLLCRYSNTDIQWRHQGGHEGHLSPPVRGYAPLKRQKWQKSAIFGKFLDFFGPLTHFPPHCPSCKKNSGATTADKDATASNLAKVPP